MPDPEVHRRPLARLLELDELTRRTAALTARRAQLAQEKDTLTRRSAELATENRLRRRLAGFVERVTASLDDLPCRTRASQRPCSGIGWCMRRCISVLTAQLRPHPLLARDPAEPEPPAPVPCADVREAHRAFPQPERDLDALG